MIYLLDATNDFNVDRVVDDVRTRNLERGTLVRKEDLNEIRFKTNVETEVIKRPDVLIAEYREKRARITREADAILDEILAILGGENGSR